jgi:hypothetical protein
MADIFDKPTRFEVWRETAWRRWWVVMTGAFALAANWDTIVGWFGAADTMGMAKQIPKLEAKTWWILWLLLTVIVLLEAIYRLGCETHKIRAELSKKRQDQTLSDLLSDKHDYAIHELLNKPPIPDNEESFKAWDQRVHQWTQQTIEIMKQYNCTKQDIRGVNSLGLFPMIPTLHKNPGVVHAMSMLVERMQRIGDVARKYGD